MISAQSPLHQTVEQFLQMVQENGVSVIVTLTREEEQDDTGIGINLIASTTYNHVSLI